jgi:FkbM family methyltransferase
VPLNRHEKKGFFLPAFERERKRGVAPKCVLDVGASDGRWSLEAAHIFPSARYHLIEPLIERRDALYALSASRPNFSFVLAAAAERVGTGLISVSEDLDGSALSAEDSKVDGRPVTLTTIDEEVRKCKLPPPYLIKLDTHGFERQILEGATCALLNTVLCVVEVYNFELFEGSWRFGKLNEFMERNGFRCSDIVNLVWRPGDEMLWQFDMFFKPASSPEFRRNSYR